MNKLVEITQNEVAEMRRQIELREQGIAQAQVEIQQLAAAILARESAIAEAMASLASPTPQ